MSPRLSSRYFFCNGYRRRKEHLEITFSAHQKLFHAKLEKLKGSIKSFPDVFISCSPNDQRVPGYHSDDEEKSL